ncbi:MAG: Glutamate--tRNA ligase [uncultured marine phage]|uniref:glutamate--tRNA ligase n=1 Tax=uncultured marine phage TaxID=707152 RepID=A0A8D9C9N8_9VIRU|nr:MAG: Glutamate--tRNA ligase [uncultured marine phage]
MSKVRTRFAPSPTGQLHVGGLRTALFCYLFAKQNDGDFILRIEDTDQKRFVETAEDYIRRSLDWVGISPDESPWNPSDSIDLYRQSERAKAGIYDKYIKQLLDTGKAYYAFDTSDELTKMRDDLTAQGIKDLAYGHKTRGTMKNSFTLSDDEVKELIDNGTPYVVRFNTPKDELIIVDDMIRGTVKLQSNVMDDKVLLKADGIPTYHMANIVDDYEMGITHVIRGEEWLPSVSLHAMLYDALGLDRPTFAHLPLILNPNGKGKLSKRSGITNGFSVFPLTCDVDDGKGNMINMKGYDDQGYDPKAFINFLALLGWTPTDDQEVLSLDEMVADFDMGRVSKAGCRFDLDKLNWFNSQYVNKLTVDDVFGQSGMDTLNITREKLEAILELAKERAVLGKDMNPIINIFVSKVDSYTNSDQLNDEFKDTFRTFVDTIDQTGINFKEGQKIKDYIYQVGVKDKGHKFGKIMPGLRQALTGGISGPDLMTTMTILGKDVSINRIKKALV